MVVKLKIKDVVARNFRSDIVNVSFRLAERDMFNSHCATKKIKLIIFRATLILILLSPSSIVNLLKSMYMYQPFAHSLVID